MLFSHTDLVLAAGKGFPIVTGAATVTAFPSLRSDFARMSYASYGAELLDQVLAEGQPDEQLFLLILQTLHLLEYIDPWLAVRYLELRLLEQQGYRMELRHCLRCGAPLQGERFRGLQGGLLCRACSFQEQAGPVLLQEGLTVLRAFDRLPLHKLGLVYISREGRRSVEQYLDLQLQQLLSWPLKSKDFFEAVGVVVLRSINEKRKVGIWLSQQSGSRIFLCGEYSGMSCKDLDKYLCNCYNKKDSIYRAV